MIKRATSQPLQARNEMLLTQAAPPGGATIGPARSPEMEIINLAGNISPGFLNELRRRTNASLSECSEAAKESKGDLAQAITIIQQSRAQRLTGEGSLDTASASMPTRQTNAEPPREWRGLTSKRTEKHNPQASPPSTLTVSGEGVEIDLFQISHAQYEEIAKQRDIHLVDRDDWSLTNIGEIILPSDAIANLEVNDNLSLPHHPKLVHINGWGEPLDKTGQGMTESQILQLTENGKYYALRAWTIRNTDWSEYEFKGEFEETSLRVRTLTAKFGSGAKHRSYRLYDVAYLNATKTSNGPSTAESKDMQGFLIDKKGAVTRIE